MSSHVFSSDRDDPKLLGQDGEDWAARYLQRLGFRIIMRNFRCRTGEVDLIASEGETLCFVEVKTRRGHSHGSGWEAVSYFKQKRIIRAAAFYLSRLGLDDIAVRFDVVSIDFHQGAEPRICLLKNAFESDGWAG